MQQMEGCKVAISNLVNLGGLQRNMSALGGLQRNMSVLVGMLVKATPGRLADL